MSNLEPTPPAPPSDPEPRPQGIGGCLSVFLVLIGIALLLPGICSLLFMAASGVRIGADVAGLILLTFAIAAGGIALIAFAVRNR
jgi:hypothetical protein